jgi:hypothetical protein
VPKLVLKSSCPGCGLVVFFQKGTNWGCEYSAGPEMLPKTRYFSGKIMGAVIDNRLV